MYACMYVCMYIYIYEHNMYTYIYIYTLYTYTIHILYIYYTYTIHIYIFIHGKTMDTAVHHVPFGKFPRLLLVKIFWFPKSSQVDTCLEQGSRAEHNLLPNLLGHGRILKGSWDGISWEKNMQNIAYQWRFFFGDIMEDIMEYQWHMNEILIEYEWNIGYPPFSSNMGMGTPLFEWRFTAGKSSKSILDVPARYVWLPKGIHSGNVT